MKRIAKPALAGRDVPSPSRPPDVQKLRRSAFTNIYNQYLQSTRSHSPSHYRLTLSARTSTLSSCSALRPFASSSGGISARIDSLSRSRPPLLSAFSFGELLLTEPACALVAEARGCAHSLRFRRRGSWIKKTMLR